VYLIKIYYTKKKAGKPASKKKKLKTSTLGRGVVCMSDYQSDDLSTCLIRPLGKYRIRTDVYEVTLFLATSLVSYTIYQFTVSGRKIQRIKSFESMCARKSASPMSLTGISN